MTLDKLLHALVGFAIATVLIRFGWDIALGVVVVIAALKEMYDEWKKTDAGDLKDILATVAGGALAIVNALI